jgi:hypothetical protein
MCLTITMCYWLQVSDVTGLWLRGWTLLPADSTALSSPSALAGLRVLQMEGSVAGEKLCLSLSSLRWLWLEGAAATLAQPSTWALEIEVNWHAMITYRALHVHELHLVLHACAG